MSPLSLSLVLVVLLANSWSLSPPNAGTSSLTLTRDLMGLDLGYSIANEKLLRENLGAGVDVINRRMDGDAGDYEYVLYEDRGAADYDGDVEYADGDERFFYDHEDSDPDEALPSPLKQFRDASYEDDDYSEGGPNPVGLWLDPTFWGRRPGRWGAFGGRPRRPPRRPRPQHRPPPPAHHDFGFSAGPPARESPRPHKKLFVGDQHQCHSGSCEFFLFCWLGGGVVKGGCGGFLFACCQRPNAAVNSDYIVARVSPHENGKVHTRKKSFCHPKGKESLQCSYSFGADLPYCTVHLTGE